MSKRDDELARLRAELADLKGRLPEHCSGTQGYVGHQPSIKLVQKIEVLEERISQIKSGSSGSQPRGG